MPSSNDDWRGHTACGPEAVARLVYVIYPAARLDGWEVVEEGDAAPAFFATLDEAVGYVERRARHAGGAQVRLENWFGDTVRTWDAPASAADS